MTTGSTGESAALPDRLAGLVAGGRAAEVVEVAADWVAAERARQAHALGELAHDLRTPLSGLVGMVQTLLRRSLDEATTHEFLERCEAACHRLEALIDDVELVAQLDGDAPIEMEDGVEPAAVVTRVAEAAGGEVVVEVPAPLPAVRTDPYRLGQALARLVDNAGRYSATRPRLLGTVVDGAVRLAVVDDGPGIEAEYVPRLTERFFRVPGDRRRGRAGLGLSVARQLAEAIGAVLVIETAPGAGSTFALDLPVAAPPAPRVRNAQAPPAGSPAE